MTGHERDKLKLFLCVKQNGKCARCKTKLGIEPCKLNSMELDHVNPQANGGADLGYNVELVCFRCNRSKGGKVPADLRPSIFDGMPRSPRGFARYTDRLTVPIQPSDRDLFKAAALAEGGRPVAEWARKTLLNKARRTRKPALDAPEPAAPIDGDAILSPG